MTQHEQQIKHGNTEHTQPTEHEQLRILDPEPNILFIYPVIVTGSVVIISFIIFCIEFFF